MAWGFESPPGYKSGQLLKMGKLSAYFLHCFWPKLAENVENRIDAKGFDKCHTRGRCTVRLYLSITASYFTIKPPINRVSEYKAFGNLPLRVQKRTTCQVWQVVHFFSISFSAKVTQNIENTVDAESSINVFFVLGIRRISPCGYSGRTFPQQALNCHLELLC